MRFISLILAFVFAPIALALPVLLTKQKADSLRYLSKDGKFTYYQTESGVLYYASNYTNNKILEGAPGTQYLVTKFQDNEILIEAAENFHQDLNFNRDYTIYRLKLGDAKANEIAQGRNGVIHPYKWFSYFKPKNREIIFKRDNAKEEIKIKLVNQINPFFMPQVAVISPDTFIYTDINTEGHMAVLQYNVIDQSYKTLYKTRFSSSKIDFCLSENNLFLGEFPLYNAKRDSSITQIPLFNNPEYKTQSIIYQSPLPDLGHLLCDEQNIFFVKTISVDEKINTKITEIARLNFQDRKLKVLSNLESVNQIIEMDGKIIIPHRGTFYLAKGSNETRKDSIGAGNE